MSVICMIIMCVHLNITFLYETIIYSVHIFTVIYLYYILFPGVYSVQPQSNTTVKITTSLNNTFQGVRKKCYRWDIEKIHKKLMN